MSRIVAINVRDFALPVPRTGSIEAHSGYGPLPQAGVEIHVAFQAAREAAHASYRSEYQLTHLFEADGFRFRVGGRADGLFEGPYPVVEEIKSAFDADELCRRLAERPDHPYNLQLLTYAYFYYKKVGVVPTCRMIVVSSRTRVATEIDVAFDPSTYEIWLERRLAELVVEEKAIRARVKRRKGVAKGLAFPFDSARPGQNELMGVLTEAPEGKRHFLIQAPTGLGKTVGILFPSLKDALSRGAPLLYITPKNSQHRVAENALRQLHERGAKGHGPRAMTLTAKSRICMKGEPVCNPKYCEYALDYYKKIDENRLVEKLGRRKLVTESTLKSFARKYEVCPYELSLDAAHVFDAVIGDYNYVIQPHGLTGRIEAKQRGRNAAPNLVIDEAHNLFPRANDNLSAALSRRELEDLGREVSDLPSVPRDVAAEGRSAVAAGVALIEKAAPRGGGKAAPVKVDVAAFAEVTARMQTFVARYLTSDAAIASKDPVLRLGGYWTDFVQALSGEGDAFACIYERERRDEILRVICCDASQHLRESFVPFARVVGFSATLKPFDYYAKLSGFDLEALATAEFSSPFPAENRKLLVIPQVSTKLRDRGRNVGKIADAIARLVAVRPGTYIAFFPSFQFLTDVAAHLLAPGFRVILQTPGMSRAETNAILGAIHDATEPTVVLAVQGGGLAEGVDYPGEQLIGAIIVGPALPSCDLPREILKKYYDRHYGQGADYAYTYPAMAKVVQAAGRVIRTETDKGLIVLMDARFVEPRFSALLPSDWFKESVQELVSSQILHDVDSFWQVHRAGVADGPGGGDAAV